MLKNIKAAIFDLDGTLVDSMGLWEKIDVDYLNMIGHEKPKNLKEEINHLSFQQTAIYFKERFHIEDSLEVIMNTWHKMAYDEYKENIKLKPGAKEFLESLKKQGIKIGLATSNSTQLLEVCLKSNGVYDLFDSITITAEAKRDKSFPDVYLLSANKLGVSPVNCIVFEDILPAVQGAKSAGMRVAAVEDSFVTEIDRQALKIEAHYYINNYMLLI